MYATCFLTLRLGIFRETPSIDKGFGPLSLMKITNFCIRRLLKSWLHCNHILFGPSVTLILPVKHQTLLKIAYPITRPVFKHYTVQYLEKHRLSKEASGLYPLQKLQTFCIRRMLKGWLHCNYILFDFSLSNFLPAKHQTLLKIAYPFTRLAFKTAP